MDFSGIRKARKSAGITQDGLAAMLGINRATVSKYESGQIVPSLGQLGKIAKALNTTVSEMVGQDWDGWKSVDPSDAFPQEKAPALNEKDQRDIARDLENIMDALENAGDLQFDGDPMSDEARESIRAAMKLGLEAAKVKNKERFTPKKYRKG